MRLIELLITLVETRAKNRQTVLKHCLEPLANELDDLHAKYIQTFASYRRTILDHGVTDDLRTRIESDLQAFLSHRAILAEHSLLLGDVSDKIIDGHRDTFGVLCRSIAHYVNMSDKITDWTHVGLIAIDNPTFTRLRVRCDDSEDGEKAVLTLLDAIEEKLEADYKVCLRAIRAAKSYLLTGKPQPGGRGYGSPAAGSPSPHR